MTLRRWFGKAKLKIGFSFVSALTFFYICAHNQFSIDMTRLRFLLALGAFLALFHASAQRIADYGILQSVPSLSVGWVTLSDDYLSPLTYAGWEAQLKGEWWRPFAVQPEWTHRTVLAFSAATTTNVVKSNTINYFGLKTGWGAHYHYTCAPDLQILVGPQWRFDMTAKAIARNTNRPASIDITTNIDLSVGISYLLKGRKMDTRFRYLAAVPMIGCMFVPEMGASYYEVFGLGDTRNAFHFSSFHNMVGVQHEFTVDFRLAKNTFRVGLEHEYKHWHANTLSFMKHRLNLNVAYVMDISFQSGKEQRPLRREFYVW